MIDLLKETIRLKLQREHKVRRPVTNGSTSLSGIPKLLVLSYILYPTTPTTCFVLPDTIAPIIH